VWVVCPLALLAAVALAAWRRWTELCALVAGMVLIILFVQGIKTWTDRPRPPDGLVSASGSSFPSAHAAYSTLYAWIAATVALRLVPGITRRSLVIGAGIAAAALIGLTRAYLRVHWLSDVTAGWALGVSCFAAAAVVVLVFAHIRDNPRRHGRDPQLDSRAAPRGGN
jgi:membrane-associated phospholipid phosphatase